MSVCVCVCVYVRACFILTEINAVARIQSLAVDTEVVFDGEVDGSRVQCVCFVCLYLRGAEEEADSTDVSVGLGIHSRSTAPQIVWSTPQEELGSWLVSDGTPTQSVC